MHLASLLMIAQFGQTPFLTTAPPAAPYIVRFGTVPEAVLPAFRQLPEVQPILPAEPGDGFQSSPAPEPPPAGHSAVFDAPAHFPVAGFDLGGWPLTRDAVVIYEGMSVTLTGGGYYEVQFVVEAPATHVTIQLQFELWRQGLFFGTITLPPVRLDSRTEEPLGNLPSRAWAVRHRGYSHRLNLLACRGFDGVQVVRSGTARWGAMPE